MKYILINGKKRSGKNFFATLLQGELKNLGYSSRIVAFADPIKDIISKSFGISINELDDYKNSCTDILARSLILTNFRSLLQNFGTEAMQSQFGADVWVNLLKEKTKKENEDFIIVPDFRFLIEHIPDSITVKILNKNTDIDRDSHRSENELNDFKFHYYIDNSVHKNILAEVKLFTSKIFEHS